MYRFNFSPLRIQTLLFLFVAVACKGKIPIIPSNLNVATPMKTVTDAQATGKRTPVLNTTELPKTTCETAFRKTMKAFQSGSHFKPFFHWYKSYKDCNDGAYAAGIEGAISSALASKWHQLKELESFCKDEGFKDFFTKQIGADVSGSEKELMIVVAKKPSDCPTTEKTFCLEIQSFAAKALRALTPDSNL